MSKTTLRFSLATLLAAAGSAQAQVLYTTDFEQPLWALGQRVYQSNGWDLGWVGGNRNIDTISGDTAVSGRQSLRQDSTPILPLGSPGGTGRLIDFDTVVHGRPIIKVDWDQFIRPGSPNPAIFGMALFSGAGSSPWPQVSAFGADSTGAVWMTDQTGEALPTPAQAPLNEWFHMQMVVDFAGRTYSVYVDGAPVAENAPINSAADHYLRGMGTLTYALAAGPTSQGYIDDLRLEAFPASLPCYPDCDTTTGAGVLDIFDFLCFQNRFDAGNPYACDCDTTTGAGVCDIFDFLCFQNAFDAGCP